MEPKRPSNSHKMNIQKISLVPAGIHADERGSLTFFNTFDMSSVKRCYIIEHPDTGIIRAWQGHRWEQKWFHVIAGAFKLAVVKPDNWQKPSAALKPEVYELGTGQPAILYVPGGYATGFRALQNHARMIVFSDATVAESQKDDYRFDKNLWSEIWITNR